MVFQAFTNNLSYVYENFKKIEINQKFWGINRRGGKIGILNENLHYMAAGKELGRLGNRTDRSINACI
jgi:hypothetical protein